MQPPHHGIKGAWPWILALALIWILQIFAVPFAEPYSLTIIVYAGINIILAVSLNLVIGFTGQFSMGHAGFMAIGAYLSAFLTTWLQASHPQLLSDPVIGQALFCGALAIGGLGAGVCGYLVGLPTLRLRGDYLAIVTLGFGEIIRVLILNLEVVGGARGLPGILQLANFGWVFSFALLAVLLVWRLVNCSYGREMLAVREDEIAAESMGVNTTSAKVRAFVMGAFLAGLAGGLFAHYLQFLTPSTFDFNRSFEIIIMVVFGGMGSVSGSIVAAVFLTIIREALRPLQDLTHLDFRMIIYSLTLILLMLVRPYGIFGTREVFEILPKALRDKLGLRKGNA